MPDLRVVAEGGDGITTEDEEGQRTTASARGTVRVDDEILVAPGGTPKMNLRVLRTSRRNPRPGDLFALLPPGDLYLFGRVVSVDASPLGAGRAILVYLYSHRSADKRPPSFLSHEDLLVPPMMTNKLPWSRGYFEFVEHRPLAQDDRLRVHCFERSWTHPKQYFDERGTKLSEPLEPLGTWGLESFRTIDDKVSTALGIPLSVDE